jgi:hypothetical protein
MWLFFGCRLKELDLYRDEKDKMLEEYVLNKEFLALSREPGIKKVSNSLKICVKITLILKYFKCIVIKNVYNGSDPTYS